MMENLMVDPLNHPAGRLANTLSGSHPIPRTGIFPRDSGTAFSTGLDFAFAGASSPVPAIREPAINQKKLLHTGSAFRTGC
jgi:hypothetical protein